MFGYGDKARNLTVLTSLTVFSVRHINFIHVMKKE